MLKIEPIKTKKVIKVKIYNKDKIKLIIIPELLKDIAKMKINIFYGNYIVEIVFKQWYNKNSNDIIRIA